MKERDKDIEQYLNSRLPEPEIGANEAWTEMQNLLDGNANATKTPWYARLKKWWWVGALLVALTGIGWLLLHFPDSNSQVLTVPSNGNTAIQNILEKTGPNTPKIAEQESKKQKEHRESGTSKELPSSTLEETPAPEKEIQRPAAHSNIQKEVNLQKANTTPLFSRTQTRTKRERQDTRSAFVRDNRPISRFTNPHPINQEKTRFVNTPPGNDVKKQSETSFSATASGGLQTSSIPDPTTNTASVPTKTGPTTIDALPVNSLSALFQLPRIIAPKTSEQAKSPRTASKKRTLEIGPQWNLEFPLEKSSLIWNTTSTTAKNARLFIPGIYIRKTWNKSAITLSAQPNHSFFTNGQMISAKDSIRLRDSTYRYSQKRLEKAFGYGVSIDYSRKLFSDFLLHAGLGFNRNTHFFIANEIRNQSGRILSDSLAVINSYPGLRADQFLFRAGLSYNPGRFQIGTTGLFPLTNSNRTTNQPIRNPNWQVFIRWRIY